MRRCRSFAAERGDSGFIGGDAAATIRSNSDSANGSARRTSSTAAPSLLALEGPAHLISSDMTGKIDRGGPGSSRVSSDAVFGETYLWLGFGFLTEPGFSVCIRACGILSLLISLTVKETWPRSTMTVLPGLRKRGRVRQPVKSTSLPAASSPGSDVMYTRSPCLRNTGELFGSPLTRIAGPSNATISGHFLF